MKDHPLITLLGASSVVTLAYGISKATQNYHEIEKIRQDISKISKENSESANEEENSFKSIDIDNNKLQYKYSQLKEYSSSRHEELEKKDEIIEEQYLLIDLLINLLKEEKEKNNNGNKVVQKLEEDIIFLRKRNLQLLHLADKNEHLIEENEALRNTLHSIVKDYNELNTKNESLAIENFRLRMHE